MGGGGLITGGHNIIHMQSSIVTLDLRIWACSIPRSKDMGSTIVLSGANHLQREGNQSVNFISHRATEQLRASVANHGVIPAKGGHTCVDKKT